MAYVTNAKLRNYYNNQALNSPIAQQYGIRGPLSNADEYAINAINKLGTPGQQGFVPNSLTRDALSKARNPKFSLGDAAKSAAGVGADVLMDAGLDSIGKGGGLKGFFANTKSNLGNAWKNVKAGKGIAPSFSKYANIGMGINAGLSAIQGLSNYSDAKSTTDDLITQILASAGANPNLHYDLSPEQLLLLRKLRSGSYDSTGDLDLSGILGNAGNIITGAGMGFLTGGGIPGAVLGGLSGVVDGISSSTVANQERINAELEALYATLYEAEANNRAMRKNAAMQRYQQSLY